MFFDLTHDFSLEDAFHIAEHRVHLKSAGTEYTGVKYLYTVPGMASSYLDLPGHIAETDDGRRGDSIPANLFYRMPAKVLRLHRQSGDGAVTADDLLKSANGDFQAPCIIVNALGDLNPRDIDERSVYLTFDALEFLQAHGCRLLVSDIFESQRLDGVFLWLFRHGISTVCEPINLGRLPLDLPVCFSAIFPPLPATQLPCRIFAETEERKSHNVKSSATC
ncbi:MAG: cyclase family protein [Victivallales bacterium]|nr:cyclase family protein [Victivallales bacterium]